MARHCIDFEATYDQKADTIFFFFFFGGGGANESFILK